MSILIGHASSNENKTILNGKPGDQTTKEVCIRSWYSAPWKYVLRPVHSGIANKSAKACEAGCANNLIGYDQARRNSCYSLAKAKGYDLTKIDKACEVDCSSFMTLCAICGGVKYLEYSSNAPTTSNMVDMFIKSGLYEVFTASQKHLESDTYLQRGDILVKPGSHTVMVLSNGSAYYGSKLPYSFSTREVQVGSFGEDVRATQWCLFKLKYLASLNDVDGEFGPGTKKAVIAFQRAHDLETDGIVGSATKKAMTKLV